MLRTLRRPRWLLLLGVLVVIVVAFVRLGAWQLNVAQDRTVTERLEEQASRPTVAVTELLEPHQRFPQDGSGRSVTATGSYDSTRQFLVPERVLEGRQGYWVLTPLVLEDGGVLPVMRGFVDTPAAADTPPPVPVTVTGTLAPGEAPAETALPAGQRGSIDLAALANEWPEELYNAFVFAAAENPTLTGATVTVVPAPTFTDGSLDWRNLGYALQWWVFAAFACLMFYRFLADASRPRKPLPDDPRERTPDQHV